MGGEERRNLDTYDILRDDIRSLRDELRPMSDKLGEHESKLTNGLSELPARVEKISDKIDGVRSLIISILVVMLFGIGGAVWAIADRFIRLESSVIEHHTNHPEADE